MEEFFQYGSRSQREVFWVEEGAFPLNQSAFVRYPDRPHEGIRSKISCGLKSNHRNLNKRMIEFLRRNWTPVMEGRYSDRERCHRHMINERMRRDREKQCYSAVHSLLRHGTKKDKKSIVQAAAMEIQELQSCKEELERRNNEMAAILGRRKVRPKIELRVGDPSSGIDSMVEVLKCVRNLGSKTRAIQSKFSAQELSAVLEIDESDVNGLIGGAAEVEKAVQKTLFDVERKFRSNVPN